MLAGDLAWHAIAATSCSAAATLCTRSLRGSDPLRTVAQPHVATLRPPLRIPGCWGHFPMFVAAMQTRSAQRPHAGAYRARNHGSNRYETHRDVVARLEARAAARQAGRIEVRRNDRGAIVVAGGASPLAAAAAARAARARARYNDEDAWGRPAMVTSRGVPIQGPPAACPKGGVFFWGALQVLIGIDVLAGVLTTRCGMGDDLAYECVHPYAGCPEHGGGVSFGPSGGCDAPGILGTPQPAAGARVSAGPPATSATELDMTTMQFFDSCCALTGCCGGVGLELGNYGDGLHDDGTRIHPVGATNVDKSLFPSMMSMKGRHSVRGQACCDPYCFEGDSEAAQNFFCDGYTIWMTCYFLTFILGVIGVSMSARDGRGAGPAFAGLGAGSVLLYMVWIKIVPTGTSWHFVLYTPHVYMQYTFCSNMLLWGMSRRARVARLQYELRYGQQNSRNATQDRNRNDSSDEEDLAAIAARAGVVLPLPLPAPADEEEGGGGGCNISSIVEGVEVSAAERDASQLFGTQSNPLNGLVVSQADVAKAEEKAAGQTPRATAPSTHTDAVLDDDVVDAALDEDVSEAGCAVEDHPATATATAESERPELAQRAVTQAAVEESDV
jgi:hypothetical protein